jgi:glycosyltransferase involved in cell wall biosynthesis
MPDLPEISIITPSFNQGQYIEKTIWSVLDQGYPNLEYIIIDGGSTDGTLDILKKYEGIIQWRSEPDNGQANAINKGLRQSSGQVIAYLNSDDLLLPGTLHAAGQFFNAHPQAAWLSGYCQNIDENEQPIRQFIRFYKNFWLRIGSYKALLILNYIAQPATFWRRSVMEDAGYLDESLHYTMDYDYWLRIGRKNKLHTLKQDLARFRLHAASKSGATTHKQFDEELLVAGRYAKGTEMFFHKAHRDIAVLAYRIMMASDN